MAGDPIRTVYLGQFDDERAERLAGMLERAGIVWSYKQPSRITQVFFVGEWGTRLFVDGERLEEAKTLVAQLDADKENGPSGANP
jgi:hypothetical protein